MIRTNLHLENRIDKLTKKSETINYNLIRKAKRQLNNNNKK